jgi:ABC-type phosphate transport system substrate-binding protein
VQQLVAAIVQGLLSRAGSLSLFSALAIAVLGRVAAVYRLRRRLTYRRAVDGKLGLVPNPGAGDEDPTSNVLRTLDQVSVVAVRFRNTGNHTIGSNDYSTPIRLKFTGRYIVDFRISDPEPELVRDKIYLRKEIEDRAYVSRWPQPDDQGDPAPAINQRSLRTNLPTALSGTLHDDDKNQRTALTLPSVELPARSRFTLLVHLHERQPHDGDLTKGYELDGRLQQGKGKVVDATFAAPKITPARVFTVLVPLIAGALAVVLLIQSAPFSPPKALNCAQGSTKLVGSTAFRPVTEAIAAAYRDQCGKDTVTVEANGSLEGLRELQDAKNANDVGMLSDGPAPPEADLQGRPVAVIVFTLVVNREVKIDRLTVEQVRGIYQGRYTNWRQLGSTTDLPIRLVGRNADSGTRQAFEHNVLNAREPAVTSDTCEQPIPPSPGPIRCERKDTVEVLRTVDQIPGALGYAGAVDAAKFNSVRLRLEDQEPLTESLDRGYPFWTVEYLYTKGVPSNDLVLKQLNDYLSTDTARERIRAAGYLPCVDQSGAILDLCNKALSH